MVVVWSSVERIIVICSIVVFICATVGMLVAVVVSSFGFSLTVVSWSDLTVVLLTSVGTELELPAVVKTFLVEYSFFIVVDGTVDGRIVRVVVCVAVVPVVPACFIAVVILAVAVVTVVVVKT